MILNSDMFNIYIYVYKFTQGSRRLERAKLLTFYVL